MAARRMTADEQGYALRKGKVGVLGTIDLTTSADATKWLADIPCVCIALDKGDPTDVSTVSGALEVRPRGRGSTNFVISLPSVNQGAGAIRDFRFNDTLTAAEAAQAVSLIATKQLDPVDVDTWVEFFDTDARRETLRHRLSRFLGADEEVSGVIPSPIYDIKENLAREKAIHLNLLDTLLNSTMALTQQAEIHLGLRRSLDLCMCRIIEINTILRASSKSEKDAAVVRANRLARIVVHEGKPLPFGYNEVYRNHQ